MPPPCPHSSHLDGRLALFRLPVCPVPPPPHAPDRKRLDLPVGELVQLTDDASLLHYLAVLEIRAGTVRGDHVHPRREEWFYLVAGAATLHAAVPGQATPVALPLQPGDLVRIQPGLAHGLQVTQPGWAVEFSSTPFDPADTRRCPVVPARPGFLPTASPA
ncbi:MAG: cupin domain-containing protein [Verrucomicrobiota bacterium]